MRNRVSLAALCVALALACPARATVTSTASSASYTCTGTVTTFTIPFPYLAASQIVAVEMDAAGVVTTVIGTVKPSIAPTSGTLTLSSACPSGSTLTISRSVALTQPQSFRTGSYKGASHEAAFDRATMQIQQNYATHAADKIAQAARDNAQDASISAGSAGGNATLITPVGGSAALSIATMFGDLRNVRGFGAIGDGAADDRAAFAMANAATGVRWVPIGTYRIASSITLGGVWRFAAGAALRPTSGNTVTFDTTTVIYGNAPVVDTSAGGIVTYQAGASKVTTQVGPSAKTANIIDGFAGNAVASDVGLSTITGGGNTGTENLIGYSELLDRDIGNGVTTAFTTSFDAVPANILVSLIRADLVRVLIASSQFSAVQSGTKVLVTYPLAGHFVNDGTGGAEGVNAAVLSTQKLYISSSIKTAVVGSGSDYSAIYGGYDNVTTGLRNSVEGAHHRITAGTHDTIFGGSYGRISGAGDYNAIFGGSGNEISAGGSGSFISGFGNTVAGAGPGIALGSTNSSNGAGTVAIGSSNAANANGAVVLGRSNTSSGADTFVSGSTNTVTAPFSTVGGFTNSVTNATGYSLVAGRQNTTSGAYGLVAGQSNTVTADWTRASGKNANATLPFCDVIGGEQLAALGDVQTRVCVGRRQTVDATPSDMRLGASGARAVIPTNTTWTFLALVSARVVGGTVSSGWEVRGVIKNDGGTVSIVGTVSNTLLGQDAGAAAWVMTATADNTNKALSLTATGAAATTINWVARITLSEVGG